MNARALACAALKRVSEGGYSQLVLDGLLDEHRLSGEDRAFCAALFYGVLDRSVTLDYVIKKLSGKTPKKLEPSVLIPLRMGVYQLLFMDKVPAFAAINESVELVKQTYGQGAAGFVNAVLRSAAEFNISDLPAGKSEFDLSVRYSCTPWIVHRLCCDLGTELCESTLEYFLRQPNIYARVNRLRCTAEELADSINNQLGRAAADVVDDNSILLHGAGNIELLDAYRDGLMHIQDLSSQRCAECVGAAAGMKVLDLCAAPGGKSFTMAEIMQNSGQIVACDLHDHRTGLIKNGANRLGLSIIETAVNDATVYNGALGTFDRVLCDVPCSGLGIIGRKPDIKLKKEAEVADLPQIQRKILDTAARYVAVGGTVTYSTCTLLRAENNEVFDDFLRCHPDFEPLYLFDCNYCKTFLPATDNTDGFFVAAARRTR